jgi:hypothetical protein
MKYGIDPKVWSAIIGKKKPTLPRIMFAAALDPLLIHDLGEIAEPRSLIECVRLADMGTRGDLRDYLRSVLVAWIMEQDTSHTAIRPIAKWDQRLSVWLAAAAAETVLRFVPQGEDSPARAVQAAREWVYGSATYQSVRAAADAADVTADAARSAAAYAAEADTYAAEAAYYAADAAYHAANAANAEASSASTAVYAANAAAAEAAAAEAAIDTAAIDAYGAFYAAASLSLREPLANAVWTYPLEQS